MRLEYDESHEHSCKGMKECKMEFLNMSGSGYDNLDCLYYTTVPEFLLQKSVLEIP